MDEECDEEVSSTSTSPNSDERKESMSISSSNLLEYTNDDEHSVEITMKIDEHDEEKEEDSSQERLSNEAKELLAKNEISMAGEHPLHKKTTAET